jgi:hypothetical protein
MAEPVLDQPRVMASIGHRIAAGVAQHVSVDPKGQLGPIADGLHDAVDGVSRKWTPAFGLEDKGTRRVPLQLAQHAQFIATDRVDCGLAVLRPADVQGRIPAPLDLGPFKVGDLDGPQAVTEGNQDQSRRMLPDVMPRCARKTETPRIPGEKQRRERLRNQAKQTLHCSANGCLSQAWRFTG